MAKITKTNNFANAWANGPYDIVLKNVNRYDVKNNYTHYSELHDRICDQFESVYFSAGMYRDGEIIVMPANDPYLNNYLKGQVSRIEKVIYNPPATVIIWADGTKTVAKCDKDDAYDKQTGFLIAYLKKVLGNEAVKQLREWVWESKDNPKVRDHTESHYSDDWFVKIFDEMLMQPFFDMFKNAESK